MKRALDALEDDAAPGADEGPLAVLENVLADLKKGRLEQEAKRLASGDTRTVRQRLADEAARLAAKALQPKATGAWTEEEREALRELVSGSPAAASQWDLIAELMPTRRDKKQCCTQWFRHEDPDVLRSPFTESEVRTIIQKQLALGDVSGKWRSIVGFLEPGRHPNWCEVAWKSCLGPRLERFIAAEVDAAPSLRRAAAKPSAWKMDKEALQEEALQLRMDQGETREGAERALRSAALNLIWYDINKLRKEVARACGARHDQFVALMKIHGRSWTKIAAAMPTRDEPQVRSHAQKQLLRQ
ncbi:RNA polymerase II transcription regulator recruiting protein [Aureococcus anophagefferens]|nr:RNA polymerase II transcription regulator recruiting protein [Aureococcus anophagefferens]